MIHHLVWESDWRQLCRDGRYEAESLKSEGFIHCTRELDKLCEVANLFFQPPRNEPLLLLDLEESAIDSPIRDEDPGVGHLFPHVYGPIPLAAVRSIRLMTWTGTSWLPSESEDGPREG